MASSYNYAHRSRSQSRFPQDDFPSLDRSHRSKSLDYRNQALGGLGGYPTAGGGGYPGPGGDPYYQATRVQDDRQDQFFNDSITIPVQHVQGSQAYQSQAHHQQQQESQRAALGYEMSQEAQGGEFTTYDRSVKYNHERTDYPPVAARQHHHQQYLSEGYSNRGHQAIQAPSSRYEDYSAQEIYKGNQQQKVAAGGAHQEARSGAYERQREMDEYTAGGGVSTFGRSAAAASKSRSHHHHREWHHQQSGVGTTASRAHYANGGYYSGGGGGGFWGNRNKRNAIWGGTGAHKQRVHHKINCCCFSFKWPPWSYEECEPPRPLFYDGRSRGVGMPMQPIGPPPPSMIQQQPQPHPISSPSSGMMPAPQGSTASPSQLPPPQLPY